MRINRIIARIFKDILMVVKHAEIDCYANLFPFSNRLLYMKPPYQIKFKDSLL